MRMDIFFDNQGKFQSFYVFPLTFIAKIVPVKWYTQNGFISINQYVGRI